MRTKRCYGLVADRTGKKTGPIGPEDVVLVIPMNAVIPAAQGEWP
jgi:hypothetical protein